MNIVCTEARYDHTSGKCIACFSVQRLYDLKEGTGLEEQFCYFFQVFIPVSANDGIFGHILVLSIGTAVI